MVEGEVVGRLLGFQFILDPCAKRPQATDVRFAGLKTLKPALACRAAALIHAKDEEFSLRDGNVIYWRLSAIAHIEKGITPLRPALKLVEVEHVPINSLARIEDRLQDWLAQRIEGVLSPLVSLQKAVNKVNGTAEETLGPDAHGIGCRLVENFGTLARAQIATEIKSLSQPERAKLRKLGIRFGEHTLFMPHLLKPAPAGLLATLWALWTQQQNDMPVPPAAGRTSVPLNEDLPHAYYYACGYRPSGKRAVRLDMIERLAEQIRKARQTADMREGFAATSGMMSLVGCSGEEFDAILTSVGLRKNTVTKTIPSVQDAAPAPAVSPATVAIDTVQPDDTQPSCDDTTATMVASPSPAPLEESTATSSPEDPEAVPETDPPAQQEEVTLVLWKSAPRTPPARHKKASTGAVKKASNTTKGKQQDTPFQKTRRDGRKSNPPPQKGMRTFTAGPKTSNKQQNKDSPFAILATLKNND